MTSTWPTVPRTNRWIPKMMSLGKGNSLWKPLKRGNLLVSMLDFWGVKLTWRLLENPPFSVFEIHPQNLTWNLKMIVSKAGISSCFGGHLQVLCLFSGVTKSFSHFSVTAALISSCLSPWSISHRRWTYWCSLTTIVEIPLFQGNPGWWNVIIWPDVDVK